MVQQEQRTFADQREEHPRLAPLQSKLTPLPSCSLNSSDSRSCRKHTINCDIKELTRQTEKMARHHQWPGYREDVKRPVASCMRCQEAKPPQRTLRTKLQPITTASPGELVMIDYEKLTQAYDGSVGVLMMVDHFSKYCIAVPVKAFTALEAANAIWYHWVQLCGIPDVIHSDKGSHFENALMQELLLQMGCVKTHTSGYHPQGNGSGGASQQDDSQVSLPRLGKGSARMATAPDQGHHQL